MTFDYEKLERDLEGACDAVHEDFMNKFSHDHSFMSFRGSKLETFISGIQREFENAAIDFLEKNGLSGDPEAKKRALRITKLYAKRCVDDFSKVT